MRFLEESFRKYHPRESYQGSHAVGASAVGARVLPSKFPERIPSFPSGYSTEQDRKK